MSITCILSLSWFQCSPFTIDFQDFISSLEMVITEILLNIIPTREPLIKKLPIIGWRKVVNKMLVHVNDHNAKFGSEELESYLRLNSTLYELMW